jgi:SNF2 family DNA or RNA helicase
MLAEMPLAGLSLKIIALQDRKRELAESIVRADDSMVSSLTAEDVEMLLS